MFLLSSSVALVRWKLTVFFFFHFWQPPRSVDHSVCERWLRRPGRDTQNWIGIGEIEFCLHVPNVVVVWPRFAAKTKQEEKKTQRKMRLNDLLIRALWNTTAEDITAPYISFISLPLSVLFFSQSDPIIFCHRYREWELTIWWTLHFFFIHKSLACCGLLKITK